MVAEFVIPKHSTKQVLGESTCSASVATDVLEDLSDHDALFIAEADAYERCQALARGFQQLSGSQRTQAVDVLAANLRYICTSAQQLLSDEEPASPETLQKHRNGLKMIVHLLHIIAMQAQKDAEAAKGAENAAAKPTKGRGRKAAADDSSEWDWQHSRQQVLLAVLDVMRTDLRTLFKGLTAAERMVNLCMELALQALEVPTVTKQEGCWPACCDVLTRGVVDHEQLDFVAAALMERARKHEHVPPLAAHAAKYAEEKYNNTQLAAKLLGEFWSCSPEDYDSQYANNSKSVRQAGEVVALLAELLPKVVSNHIAQLRPYLACSKAYSIRGALMAATGSVLLKVFPSRDLNSSMGEGAVQAHLRSKETLLNLLHSRILDKAAYVRQRVLQTWTKLVEDTCAPINHWNILLAQAISRLEDESQLVVKAALQLLSKMLHQGIFPPPLDTQRYINTLRLAEAELDALLPAGKQHSDNLGEGCRSSAEGDESEEGGGAGDGGEGAGDAEAAAWEDGAIKVDAAEGEGEQDQEDSSGDSPDSHNPNREAITKCRAMIANLKEGVAFCKRLTASMRQVQVLLASSQAAVVHEAICYLTMCRTFEVTGAAKALRGMWPLVFSKTEAVRDSVLDSWNILHLHDKTDKQQVSELVKEVIPNCTLAELTALESIIGALAQDGKVLSVPGLVRLLMQDMCHYYKKLEDFQAAERARRRRQRAAGGPTAAAAAAAGTETGADASDAAAMDVDAPSAVAPAAAQDEGGLARSDLVAGLRHVFTLLSILSAAEPSAIKAPHVAVLVEVGLQSADLADAWVARYTLITLRHAAPHLVPHPMRLATSANGIAAAPTSSSSAPSDPVSPELHQKLLAAIVRLLVGHPPASMAANWPSAAEAAVAAVYALSPNPQEVMAAVLEEMFRRCRPAGASGQGSQATEQPVLGFSAAALSRFFFVLGRTSLQHLLCIQTLGKAIRQTRLAAGRAAAEAADKAREAAAAGGAKGAAGKRGGSKAAATAAAAAAAQQADDIAGMLGAGAVTADAELDDLVEMIEAQVASKQQLVGRYGQLLSKMVHLRAFIEYPQELQASAVLTLTQLMAVDGEYCSDNVQVLFTLLHKRLVSSPVRVNMVVALADLASRWPNVMEPWTEYMYSPLADPEPSVKLAALSSLTHLVLGGMVKAKGNVAKVAMLLVDDDQELVDRAVLFFESLAASGSGSSRSAGSSAAGASAINPVYNLLPDCLSTMLKKDDPPLLEEQMQVIMTQLLGYVKDKQADSLRERLLMRLQVGGPRDWRLIAWCIEKLGYTEKGLRKMMERTACYRHTLGEQQVFDMFMTMAKKGGYKASAAAAAEAAGTQGLSGDLASTVTDWVANLTIARQQAMEAAEVEELSAKQTQQQQDQEQEEDHQTGGADQSGGAEQAEGETAAGAQPQGSDAEMGSGDSQQQQQQQGADDMPAQADSAAAAAAAAGATVDDSDLQRQQLELVQSQDIVSSEDQEAALAASAAAAIAASGMQRMSLASSSSRAAAAAPAAGKDRRSGTAAAVESSAAASSRPSRSRAAAAGSSSTSSRQQSQATAKKAASRSRSKTQTAYLDSSGEDESDSSSGDEGSVGAAAVAAAGRAAVGSSRRTSARAGAAPSAVRVGRRSTQAAAETDSSSEDDD